ncbi:hypothetical protein LCGC14_2602090, partial [marine sediment metagenome]
MQSSMGSKGSQGKLEVIKAVSERIPMNSLGLPEGFYRPDMLPNSLNGANGSDGGNYVGSNAHSVSELDSPNVHKPPLDAGTAGEPHQELVVVPERDGEDVSHTNVSYPVPGAPQGQKELDRRTLAAAFVPLSYDEGFPTLPDGSPFWEQLEFEPLNAFNAFRAYLAQGRTGARQLFSLDDFLSKQQAADEKAKESSDADDPLCDPNLYDPTTVHMDTINPNLAVVEVLTEFFHLYYWSLRARSYDLFRAVVARRTREERALSIESTHYIRAEALLNRLYMAMNDDEFFEQLTPKAMIDLYKELTRVMRISSGLPGSGPLEGQAPQQTSVELILREASQGFIADDGQGTEAEYSRHVRDTILS